MGEVIYEAEYIEGVAHFNAREFFEAHEAWEDIWAKSSGPNQLFYKGLIHAAVALHHFGSQNLAGARKVFGTCIKYLTPYAPQHLGLDVETFLSEMKTCFAGAVNPTEPSGAADLDESQIPTISLDPPPDSPEED